MLRWVSRMPTTLAALCALLLLQASVAAAAKCFVNVGFSGYKRMHTYTKKNAQKDFKKVKGPFKMIKGAEFGKALTKIDGGVIRASFPKGKIKGKQTGFTWYTMHKKQELEAYMSYRIKFSPKFQWTKGGKLPGLCGGEGKKGSACPAGCSGVSRDRGFSARLMWREGGRIVTYVYYPDKPRSIRCGEDWKWNFKAKAGKWYTFTTYLKLNSGSKKNGEFKAWVDGKQVLHKKKIRFRYRPQFKISRSYITTYVGGSSVKQFAPSKNQYIWFDNFKSWGGKAKKCSGQSRRLRRALLEDAADAEANADGEEFELEDGPADGAHRADAAAGKDGADEARADGGGPIVAVTGTLGDGTDELQDGDEDDGAAGLRLPVAEPLQPSMGGVRPKLLAPSVVQGFKLVNGEAGWDLAGEIQRVPPRRGSMSAQLEDCADHCHRLAKCTAFTLLSGLDTCVLKGAVDGKAAAEFVGKGTQGIPLLYSRL